MGKNSDFERKELDKYYTPYEGVLPLLPYLKKRTKFIEPCAGDGRLIRHLAKHGHKCEFACDILPEVDPHSNIEIVQADVLFFGYELPPCSTIITNPPWDRNRDGTGILHEMIEKFRNHAPTWLLFDADGWFTGQAKPFLKNCDKIIAVGRLSGEGNGVAGKDNCAWYRFQPHECKTVFYPRPY
jgi:hypothetical protein